MPFISKELHHKPFIPRVDITSRLADAALLLETIKGFTIHASSKKKMLNHALWLVAEISGNFAPRFRSFGVLENIGIRIQRDHIYDRRLLIQEVLGENPDYKSIVERSICCLVTIEEHQKLTKVPSNIVGFKRYIEAKISIKDMQNMV